MIVIFADRKSFKNLDKILTQNVQKGYMSEEMKEKRLEKMSQFNSKIEQKYLDSINTLDCGIISMQLMLTARKYGYETNAIAGFDRKGIMKYFEMNENQYLPLLSISIGKGI